MSQQNIKCILDEAKTWDKIMWSHKIDESLPKLFSCINNFVYVEEGIEALKILCECVLCNIQLDQMNKLVFSKLDNQITNIFDAAFQKIKLGKNDEQQKYIQMLSTAVESMDTCVDTVLGLTQSVKLQDVLSLPKCVISVLNKTYTHCKHSSKIYGDLLQDVSQSLSCLFKSAHSLQTSFLNLLDRICASQPALEEHVQTLCDICEGLFALVSVVTSLDIKLVLSLWRAITKLCNQNLSLLQDRLDICPLVTYLCQEIKQGITYLLQLSVEEDDKAWSKCLRVVGFQLKVVVALLRDFSLYLGECEEHVLNLLVLMIKSLPPSLCCTKLNEKRENEIRGQLLTATDTILNHLVKSRHFRVCLTQEDKGWSKQDFFPLLRLQISVLDLLPSQDEDLLNYWLSAASHNTNTPCRDLVHTLFNTAALCVDEIRLPVHVDGVMLEGKPQTKVSLYEHIAVHLCAFIGACPASYFHTLELTLLSWSLRDEHVTSLLANDCWAFLVRYSSAETCYEQIERLVSAYTERPNHRLARLIQRLLQFLSPQHQENLVKKFPTKMYFKLWSDFSLTSFDNKTSIAVATEMFAISKNVLSSDCSKLCDVLCSLRFLQKFIKCPEIQEQIMNKLDWNDLIGSVVSIWEGLESQLAMNNLTTEPLAIELTNLTTALVLKFDCADLIWMTSSLKHMTHKKSRSSLFLFSVAEFIGAVLDGATDEMLVQELIRLTNLISQSRNVLILYKLETAVAKLKTRLDSVDSTALPLQEFSTLILGLENENLDVLKYLQSERQLFIEKELLSDVTETTLSDEFNMPLSKRPRIDVEDIQTDRTVDEDVGSTHSRVTDRDYSVSCDTLLHLLTTASEQYTSLQRRRVISDNVRSQLNTILQKFK